MALKSLFRCVGKTEEERRDRLITKQLKKDDRQEKSIVKILLLGIAESGKSTITKQMKIIHINGFSDEERRVKIKFIRKNLKDSILTILGAMNLLGIDLADKSLEESKKYLLENCIGEDFDYPRIFYDHTEKLWKDPGVLKCYSRHAEYQLIDCAKYFLDKIDVIRLDSYLPSDHDILHCRILTNSIQKIEFTVMDKKSRIPFHVFDVGGQRGERKKWIQMFDSATAILFLLDCSSFDVNVRDDFESNRLLEATEVFEHIWNSRFLKNVSLILFVNKIDLLEGKIRSGSSIDNLVKSIPSTHKYFPIYDRVYREFSKPLDQERKEFIDSFFTREKKTDNRLKFRRRSSRSPSVQPDILDEIVRTAVIIKRVFMEVANGSKAGSEGREFHRSHFCEPFYTCAIDTDNIQKVLEGVRSILIKKALRLNLLI